MDELVKNAIFIIESISDEFAFRKNSSILDEQNKKFGYYSMPYLFTNENLNAYYRQMNLDGKSMLTVVGSGDHILEAILRGASKIDAFDITPYAIKTYELKSAAIKTLEYEEFIRYFLDYNSRFDIELYQKIRPALKREDLEFWDAIYKKYKNNPNAISNLFREKEIGLFRYFDVGERANRLSNIISYLKREQYYKLREMIGHCQVTCHIRDVNHLDDLGNNYDYILLSNIVKYQEDIDFMRFRDSVSRYISKLNLLGEIKIGYFWGAPDCRSLERGRVIRDKMNLEGIEIITVPSSYFELVIPGVPSSDLDELISYQKKG